jgi:hypothetical protein
MGYVGNTRSPVVAEEAIRDRDIVQSRLEPGKQMVWIGKPAAWRFARNMLWDVVGLPVTIILAYLVSRIRTMEQPAQRPMRLTPTHPLHSLCRAIPGGERRQGRRRVRQRVSMRSSLPWKE